jgi:uncharacterized radical SAM superfamily Fe-S cluster-containing enzyme
MSNLVAEMSAKALKLNIPLNVQLDLTYRCNERCIHCYLDHDDHGEMSTAEIKGLLDQMADAGVFYLTISGGEILMRRDFFELLEQARAAFLRQAENQRGVDREKRPHASDPWASNTYRSASIRTVQKYTTPSPRCPVRSNNPFEACACCANTAST